MSFQITTTECSDMKSISPNITQGLDGEWWYQTPGGHNSRALIKTCETCSDEFATYPRGSTRFCSPECMRRPCIRCGDIFTPATKRTVYCSLACKRGEGKCEGCGTTYVFSHHGAKRFCSKECYYDITCPIGTVVSEGNGYTIIKVPPGTPGGKRQYGENRHGWMLTHRYVMQQKLGRELTKNENVHHINGQRADNRPENLELWNQSQPAGIRATDYHCPGCRCFEHAR